MDQRSAAQAESIVNEINAVEDFSVDGLQSFVGDQIQGIQDVDGSIGVVLKNGKGIKLSGDKTIAKKQLARILGIPQEHIDKLNSPVQRQSPFRRVMKFITGK